METTFPIPFLPSVDISRGLLEYGEELEWNQLSCLGCIHFAINDSTVDALQQFLQKNISIEAYVDVTRINSTDNIVTVLNAGARKVFATSAQLGALNTYRERVVPVFSPQDEATSATTYLSGVLFQTEELSISRPNLERLAANKASPIFLASDVIDFDSLFKIATEFSAVPIIPATKLTIRKTMKGKFSIPNLFSAAWQSDRADKLIPTVVTDEKGIALGLVYSSEESLAESLKTGNGVYQSRKRGLWYKGATSGDTQELVRVALDCDQDCLKFTVRQKGRGKYIFSDSEKDFNETQGFVTCLSQPVSANFEGSQSSKRPWYRERSPHLKGLILHAFFQMRNYFELK
jgi:phosphoribosyl-ATP pyrophosphohydrolase / phosphoribosyl-AMP cyclohydrolase / histidinol dehydrogenase